MFWVLDCSLRLCFVLVFDCVVVFTLYVYFRFVCVGC